MKIVGFGHSHILTLRFAAAQWKDEFDALGLNLSTHWMGDEIYKEYRVQCLDRGIDGFDFNEDLKNEIFGIDANNDFVISCFGGNAHNVLGLVQHPIPFEFRFEDELLEESLENLEIIPISLIEEIMQSQGGFPETIWSLRNLRNYYSGILLHCESPPPIYDEDYLIKYAGPFAEMFEKNGITHANLRRKLWRLHSRLIKNECDLLGIHFISAPSNFLTLTGFLTENGLAQDTTHASKEYGRSVIYQILDKIKTL